MLDKKNEQGYALLESLIGLMLLSIVSISLVVALPILLEESARLDKEQAIFYHLIEFHDRKIENNVTITAPVEFEAVKKGHQWCAFYRWRDGLERTICL